MSEAATAVISATQLAPSNFQYTVTLTDSGTTPIGTFWFAWVPGRDYLDTSPTSITAPAGWTDVITHETPTDGFGIQWRVLSTSAELTPGNSLTFSFTSADTPAQVFGNSSHFPATRVVTSFVYSGQPLSDAGFVFQPTMVPSTITATTPGQVVPLSSGNNLVFVTVPNMIA